MMSDSERQQGILTVMLERFEKILLPRALDIEAKVERGERLADFDIDFLEQVMVEAEEAKPYVDSHPEMQDFYTRAVSLYHAIVKRAAENEPTG